MADKNRNEINPCFELFGIVVRDKVGKTTQRYHEYRYLSED